MRWYTWCFSLLLLLVLSVRGKSQCSLHLFYDLSMAQKEFWLGGH